MAEQLKRRLLNWCISLDQLAYVTITLGHGSPDETMSAAAYRLEQQGRTAGKVFRPMIDFLFSWLEKDHCRLSYESELQRAQLPHQYKP